MALKMINEGFSQNQVAQKFKVSQSAISQLKRKIEKHGTVNNLVGQGRPKKLNRAELLKLKRCVNENPFFTTPKIIENCGLKNEISRWTVNRKLESFGIYNRVARKSSIFTKKHIERRLHFGRLFKEWDKRSWKDVMFSDETMIRLSGTSRLIVKRPKNKAYDKKYVLKDIYNEKRGVMFWGFFTGHGEKNIDHVEGTMNSLKYMEMLNKHLPNLKQNRILQQDRAPCHESKITRDFLEEADIITLDPWPPSSPDLNPIENMWHILKKNVHARSPKTIEDLIRIVKEEFSYFSTDYLEKLSELKIY